METITLKAGFGYKVNQDFWRLTEDTQATLVARQPNGDVWVKLPESCKFARQGNALFPRMAVDNPTSTGLRADLARPSKAEF